jgi:hypothetical protein
MKRASLAGRTIFVFSFWVFLCAAALLVAPEALLPLMGADPAGAPVARIFGVVLLFLAYYYLRLGRDGRYRRFYRWSVQTRLSAVAITAVLVLLRLVPPLVLPLLAADGIGALATLWALRTDGPTGGEGDARD